MTSVCMCVHQDTSSTTAGVDTVMHEASRDTTSHHKNSHNLPVGILGQTLCTATNTLVVSGRGCHNGMSSKNSNYCAEA
eukprot:10169643-Lingulodinium_polyedra.AAC.1